LESSTTLARFLCQNEGWHRQLWADDGVVLCRELSEIISTAISASRSVVPAVLRGAVTKNHPVRRSGVHPSLVSRGVLRKEKARDRELSYLFPVTCHRSYGLIVTVLVSLGLPTGVLFLSRMRTRTCITSGSAGVVGRIRMFFVSAVIAVRTWLCPTVGVARPEPFFCGYATKEGRTLCDLLPVGQAATALRLGHSQDKAQALT